MQTMQFADTQFFPAECPFEVTLLSAPVSSELPFCNTTLFRKQLISPMLLRRSKIGKRTLFYIVLAIKRYANRNVSVKAGFANYFSKLSVDFRKPDLSSKLLEKLLVSFATSLAGLLIYNFTKSD